MEAAGILYIYQMPGMMIASDFDKITLDKLARKNSDKI